MKPGHFSPSGELEGYVLYGCNLGALVTIGAQSSHNFVVPLETTGDSYPGGTRATPPGGGTPLEPTFPRPGVFFRPRFAGDVPLAKASPQGGLPVGLAIGSVQFVAGTFTPSQSTSPIGGAVSPPVYLCTNADEIVITVFNFSLAPVDMPANTLVNVSVERG